MTRSPVPRPTLNDIASAAGVSRSTVSLVIRDTGNISEATRHRVREVMRDLGYVYNRGAASMRSGGTRSVGVIAPDSSNLFMGEFTTALEIAMLEQRFVTLSCHSFEDPARQDALVRSLLERGVDAMVVMPAVESDERLLATLASVDVPVVVSVRPLPGSVLPFVGPDNHVGGVLTVEHLAAHGSRSFAYVGGVEALTPRRDRLAGIAEALSERSLPPAVEVASPPTGDGGIEAMERLSSLGPLPDAVICHNDSVAFGVFRWLRTRAPEDIGRLRVVGFDDVAEAALWEPPLTTVSANAIEVGERTAALLARLLSGDRSATGSKIRPRLVVRDSCGRHD